MLNKQAFDFNNIFMIPPYAKMVNSSKDGILMQIRTWSRISLSFDGLTFLNVKVDIPICSLDLTFKAKRSKISI